MNEEQPDWMRTSGEGAFCFVSVGFQDDRMYVLEFLL